jgi:hypothetical protein
MSIDPLFTVGEISMSKSIYNQKDEPHKNRFDFLSFLTGNVRVDDPKDKTATTKPKLSVSDKYSCDRATD